MCVQIRNIERTNHCKKKSPRKSIQQNSVQLIRDVNKSPMSAVLIETICLTGPTVKC